MPPGLKPMVVESVRIHMLTSQHVVILREAERDRYLPIWVGPNEADAIARRLQGVVPERPLTHDLFATALDELGVNLKQVVISELSDETYRARLVMELGDRTVDVDARSSDAIALALRVGVVIYATDDVLDRAGVTPSEAEGGDDARLSVFREFVNSLDAPDPSEGEG